VGQQIVYLGHLEKSYVLKIKRQLTDPGFADRSGALQAGSRIGEHTSFLYRRLMEILSSDALQRAKEYGMENSRAKSQDKAPPEFFRALGSAERCRESLHTLTIIVCPDHTGRAGWPGSTFI